MFPVVGLNLTPYLMRGSNQVDVLYDLVAITNHYGTDIYDGYCNSLCIFNHLMQTIYSNPYSFV